MNELLMGATGSLYETVHTCIIGLTKEEADKQGNSVITYSMSTDRSEEQARFHVNKD